METRHETNLQQCENLDPWWEMKRKYKKRGMANWVKRPIATFSWSQVWKSHSPSSWSASISGGQWTKLDKTRLFWPVTEQMSGDYWHLHYNKCWIVCYRPSKFLYAFRLCLLYFSSVKMNYMCQDTHNLLWSLMKIYVKSKLNVQFPIS